MSGALKAGFSKMEILPTFGDALVFKEGLLRNGTCSF